MPFRLSSGPLSRRIRRNRQALTSDGLAERSAPLGVPVFILVFGVGDVSPRELVRDQGFLLGLALQAVASPVSFRDLVVALHKYTPDQLGLKRRFAFVFLRWVGGSLSHSRRFRTRLDATERSYW